MTTSGWAAKPSTSQASGAAAAQLAGGTAGLPEGAGSGSSEATVPENEQELRAEIERSREALGETADQLVAKADVKGRAKAKAGELAGRVKSKTARTRAAVAGRAAKMRIRVASTTRVARQKAAAAGSTATAQAQAQARTAPVRKATPEPVRRAVAKVASTAKQRPAPLVASGAVLIAACVALRWWRKR